MVIGGVVAALVVVVVVMVAVLTVLLLVAGEVAERGAPVEPAVTVGAFALATMRQVVTNTDLARLLVVSMQVPQTLLIVQLLLQ